jgi:hypothetical protein
VNVFFDNCTSPVLASTLHGFIQHRGHEARHIMDMPCGRDATDLEWIEMLRRDSRVWLVVTGDDRIRKNKAERTAYRLAGLRGLVLNRVYQRTPMNQVASFLLWRWPDIEKLAALVSAPALFELPINRTAKLKPLPL